MNDNNERKAKRGNKVQIPAATWNAAVDAARHHKRFEKYNPLNAANSGIPSDLIRSNNTVLIRNSAGVVFPTSFHVVKIGNVITDVALNPADSNRRLAFEGLEPAYTTDSIAIVQSPLEEDGIAKAVISGVTLCRVVMLDLAHVWATATPGDTYCLQSGTHGNVKILWYGPTGDAGDAALDIYLAAVQLGVGDVSETSADKWEPTPVLQASSITAAGSTEGTATAITAAMNIVINTTSATVGVRLPVIGDGVSSPIQMVKGVSSIYRIGFDASNTFTTRLYSGTGQAFWPFVFGSSYIDAAINRWYVIMAMMPNRWAVISEGALQ